jgi:hypothetical protein
MIALFSDVRLDGGLEFGGGFRFEAGAPGVWFDGGGGKMDCRVDDGGLA